MPHDPFIRLICNGLFLLTALVFALAEHSDAAVFLTPLNTAGESLRVHHLLTRARTSVTWPR